MFIFFICKIKKINKIEKFMKTAVYDIIIANARIQEYIISFLLLIFSKSSFKYIKIIKSVKNMSVEYCLKNALYVITFGLVEKKSNAKSLEILLLKILFKICKKMIIEPIEARKGISLRVNSLFEKIFVFIFVITKNKKGAA